jgi:PAS domain S-box-containing protein
MDPPDSAQRSAQRAALDALPVVAFAARPDGSLSYVSRRWYEVTGSRPGELADAVIGLLAHEDRAGALVRWKHSVATGEPYADEARIRIADGSYRWMAARAEAVRDPHTGAIAEWFGTLTDIDEQRRSDRERDMLTALVENSTDFIGIATLAGSALYVNEAGRRLIELGSLEDARKTSIFDYFLPEDLPYVEQVIMPALAREGYWTGDFRLRNGRTGEPVEVRFNFFHIRDPRTGEPVAIATVSPDIRERARLERRLRTLVDAGAALARSLDYGATLESLADLVVRTVASFCVIDIFETDDNGERTIEQIAAVHAERDKRALMAHMKAFVPTAAHRAHPVTQVFLAGSSSLVAQIDDAWIERVAIAPAHAALLRALAPGSLLTVPLVAGGEVLGALTCGLSTGNRAAPYDAEDLFFVEELGRRAGTANARLYARERRIAPSGLAAAHLAALGLRAAGRRVPARQGRGDDRRRLVRRVRARRRAARADRRRRARQRPARRDHHDQAAPGHAVRRDGRSRSQRDARRGRQDAAHARSRRLRDRDRRALRPAHAGHDARLGRSSRTGARARRRPQRGLQQPRLAARPPLGRRARDRARSDRARLDARVLHRRLGRGDARLRGGQPAPARRAPRPGGDARRQPGPGDRRGGPARRGSRRRRRRADGPFPPARPHPAGVKPALTRARSPGTRSGAARSTGSC